MSKAESERENARRLVEELRQQRAIVQQGIEAAEKAIETARATIERSQQLLAQIDRQLAKADELDRSEPGA